MNDFPKLRAAIAASRSALTDPRGQQERDSYAAHDKASAAIASELLPALFDYPFWSETRAEPSPFKYDDSLFDHMRRYRRRWVRGAASWDNTVIVGQPYKGQSPWSGDAIRASGRLERVGAFVWHSPEFSDWFPGHTTLVIAGRDICPDRAKRLGFKRITGLVI